MLLGEEFSYLAELFAKEAAQEEPPGAYRVLESARVKYYDNLIEAATRNRSQHLLHYLFNPWVSGPFSEVGQRLARRLHASRATSPALAVLSQGAPLNPVSWLAAGLGGQERQDQARGIYQHFVGPEAWDAQYDEDMAHNTMAEQEAARARAQEARKSYGQNKQSAEQKKKGPEKGKSGRKSEKKPEPVSQEIPDPEHATWPFSRQGPYAIDQAARVRGYDHLDAASRYLAAAHPTQSWINPWVATNWKAPFWRGAGAQHATQATSPAMAVLGPVAPLLGQLVGEIGDSATGLEGLADAGANLGSAAHSVGGLVLGDAGRRHRARMRLRDAGLESGLEQKPQRQLSPRELAMVLALA